MFTQGNWSRAQAWTDRGSGKLILVFLRFDQYALTVKVLFLYII